MNDFKMNIKLQVLLFITVNSMFSLHAFWFDCMIEKIQMKPKIIYSLLDTNEISLEQYRNKEDLRPASRLFFAMCITDFNHKMEIAMQNNSIENEKLSRYILSEERKLEMKKWNLMKICHGEFN